MPTRRLTIAIALAKRGFRLFPLRPYAEDGAQKWKPAFKKPFDSATTDPQQLKAWFHEESPYGLAIATGQGLLVVDIDNKNGKDGDAEWAKLDLLEGCPDTLTLPTSSNGRHLFYSVDRPCSPGASKIAPGIDHRGDGGYVRVHNHLLDPAMAGGQIARAPDWLLQRIGRPKEKAENADTAADGADVDSDYNVARAVEFLATLDPVTEGERNMRCWQTASDVRALGIGRLRCMELMIDHWRCEPFLDDDEFEKAVNSAYDNAKQPLGVNDPDADFDPGTPATQNAAVPTKPPRLHIEWLHDITVSRQSRYVVKDVLDAGAMSVVYGPSGVGKSFFAMDLGFAVAQGKAWRGHKTQRGMVAYIAAEGGPGARKRVAAARKFHEIDPATPFALIPCSVDLLDPEGDLRPLVALVREAAASRGARCVLIVVDTLARAMGGGNENAPDDMGAFVRHIDALRQHTGAHVMVVHHSGKDQAKGARGHSSLRAATDTEIEVEPGTARVTKQRDMDPCGPFGFALESVEVGTDDEGDSIKSAVVVEQAVADADADFTLEPLRADEDKLCLRALAEAIASDGVDAPAMLGLPEGTRVATLETWRGAYRDLKGQWSEVTRQSFRRSSERLRDRRYVVAMYDFQWVSDAAK